SSGHAAVRNDIGAIFGTRFCKTQHGGFGRSGRPQSTVAPRLQSVASRSAREGIDPAGSERRTGLKCPAKDLPSLRFRPCERSGAKVRIRPRQFEAALLYAPRLRTNVSPIPR